MQYSHFRLISQVLTTFLVSFCAYSPAQIAFDHLTTEQGLPVSSVLALAEDSFGFIWAGSPAGLARFNGHRFDADLVFEPDRSPFQKMIIELEASGDQLVFMTRGKEVGWVDIRTGQVAYLPHLQDFSAPATLACDGPGSLWLAGKDWLAKIDADGKPSQLLDLKSTPLSPENLSATGQAGVSDPIHKMDVDTLGGVWVVGTKGVFKWDVNLAEFQPVMTGIQASDIQIHDSFAYSTTSAGVYKIDIHNYKQTLIPIDSYDFLGTNQIMVDQSYNIWATSDNYGVNCYSQHNQTLVTYRHKSNQPFPISAHLLSMMQDRSGRIWLGTNNGINVASKERQRFDVFGSHSSQQSLAENQVYSLCFDRSGKLWAEFESDRVVRLGKDEPIVLSPDAPGNRRLPHDIVNKLYVDRKDNLWIGTAAGAYIYNQTADQITKVEGSTGLISCFSEQDSGDMLMGGLSIMEYVQGTPARTLQVTSLPFVEIMPLGDQHYFLAGVGGPYHWDRSSNQMERPQNAPEALLKSLLLDVHKDGRGRLWLSSYGQGIWVIDDDSYLQLPKLERERVYGGLADDVGHIWFSTDNGILRISEKDLAIKRFDRRHGLPITEFNSEAFVKADDGSLYFGSHWGIIRFHAENMRAEPRPPKVLFTELLVRNQRIRPGDQLKRFSLEHRIEHTSQLRFSHREDFVSLEFSSPSTLPKDGTRFRFQVAGLSDEWVLAQLGDHQLPLTDLRAGTYNVRVQASIDEHSWSPHEAHVSIVIDPAPWETWWFNSLVVLIVFAIGAGFYRIRVGQELAVARIKQRISDDLHDDVGMVLTHIAQTAQLGQIKSQDETRSAFEQIGELTRQVIQQFRDIIWTLDKQNESWSTLIARMRLFASSSLKRQGIQVSFQREVTLRGESWRADLAHPLFMIFKECIHNIIKHASATEVDIEVELNANRFYLVVHDNGKGFDPLVPAGKGFSSIRSRAKQMNAQLDITSNDGVKVSLFLPL